jgi:hypothetical protein
MNLRSDYYYVIDGKKLESEMLEWPPVPLCHFIIIRRADTCIDMVIYSSMFYSVTQLGLKSVYADFNIIVYVCCRCILSNCVLCDEVEVCNNSELKDCLVGSRHTVVAGGEVSVVLLFNLLDISKLITILIIINKQHIFFQLNMQMRF